MRLPCPDAKLGLDPHPRSSCSAGKTFLIGCRALYEAALYKYLCSGFWGNVCVANNSTQATSQKQDIFFGREPWATMSPLHLQKAHRQLWLVFGGYLPSPRGSNAIPHHHRRTSPGGRFSRTGRGISFSNGPEWNQQIRRVE